MIKAVLVKDSFSRAMLKMAASILAASIVAPSSRGQLTQSLLFGRGASGVSVEGVGSTDLTW